MVVKEHKYSNPLSPLPAWALCTGTGKKDPAKYKSIVDCAANCAPVPWSKNKVIRRINELSQVKVSGGPFHYQMRSGTYGDVYDEAGWKVDLGVGEAKPRGGWDNNALKCRYDKSTLINNWSEERNDRKHIKYDSTPKISEYGYIYRSDYALSFSKPVCNKARNVLLGIPAFPTTVFPGHQPELDVCVVSGSAPKLKTCIVDEEKRKMQKEAEQQKRIDRYKRVYGMDPKPPRAPIKCEEDDKVKNKDEPEENQCDPEEITKAYLPEGHPYILTMY